MRYALAILLAVTLTGCASYQFTRDYERHGILFGGAEPNGNPALVTITGSSLSDWWTAFKSDISGGTWAGLKDGTALAGIYSIGKWAYDKYGKSSDTTTTPATGNTYNYYNYGTINK